MTNDNSTRVAKNSLFLAIRMVVVMIISLFTTRYILRNLGIEDYGIYNVTYGIVSMCTFLNPALANASQRYHNYELETNGIQGALRVFNAGVFIQLFLIVLFFLVCETIGLWYIETKLNIPQGRENAVFWVYQISVISFLISMIQIPILSAVLARERMNFFALVNISDSVLKLLIAIGIAYSTYDKLVTYGILLLGINIANLALYTIYAYYNFEEVRLSRRIDVDLLKSMMSFSGWNLFETLARITKEQSGNLLLNFFFGPVLNAARGVSNQVGGAFTSFVESTIMASRPQMVYSYTQGNYHYTKSMFFSLSKGVLLILYVLSFPVFLEIDFILSLWIGNRIPEYSVEFVRLSVILLFIDKLASPVTSLVHASGKVKRYHLCSGIISLLVIPVIWLFFKLGYPPTYIYIVTIIGSLIAQVLFLFIIKGIIIFSIKEYVEKTCKPSIMVMVLSSLAPMMCFFILEQGFLRLICVFILTFFVSLTLIYKIALEDNEKSLLFMLYANLIKK